MRFTFTTKEATVYCGVFYAEGLLLSNIIEQHEKMRIALFSLAKETGSSIMTRYPNTTPPAPSACVKVYNALSLAKVDKVEMCKIISLISLNRITFFIA